MVKHIVLAKFEKTTAQQEIEEIFVGLKELKNVVPGMTDFHGGPNVSVENAARGYTHAFIVEFQDPQSRDGYLIHPEHVKLAKRIVAACANGMDGVLIVDIVA